MELKVVIDKKFAFIILGGILILAGAIYGYAYGGSTPTTMGHSWGEIGEIEGVQAKISSGLSACSGNNKAIKTIDPINGDVTCETDDVGGSILECADGQIIVYSGGNGNCYGGGGSCESYGGNSVSNGCLFDNPGTYSGYRFPLNIGPATVTVLGGGGSGGTRDIGNWNNFGGAGGGAAIRTLNTDNVFDSYKIVVGAGGQSTGSSWGYRDGKDGEDSSFGFSLLATGGQRGHYYTTANPGTGIGGDTNCLGGIGTYGTYENAIGGNGECSGGAGGVGGAGGGASSLGGNGNSQIYGAGSKGTGNLDGGDGAVLIKW